MSDGRRPWVVSAGIGGAAGVVLAAASAHFVNMSANVQSNVDIAARFLMFHALALLGVAALNRDGGRWLTVAGFLLIVGCVCFSGGLCLSALVAPAFGPVIPVGGMLLIAGWLALAVAGFRLHGERR